MVYEKRYSDTNNILIDLAQQFHYVLISFHW